MKESIAEQEVEKGEKEALEEIADLTMEFPKEMAVCPYCGAKDYPKEHEEADNLAVVAEETKEVIEAVEALKAKYPYAMKFCPICGDAL